MEGKWRQAVDEEQKVRRGEEGRGGGGSTVQPRASVPATPQTPAATFYDPVFYYAIACSWLAHYSHHPPSSYIRPQAQKLESILQDTIAAFLSLEKAPFPPHEFRLGLAAKLPNVGVVWYMMWRSPKVRTLVAQFRNLYCSILPQFTSDQAKALSRGQEWGTRGF